MKSILFFLGISVLLAVCSCSKDDKGVQLQNHDENRMMDSMHAMMSRMDSVQKTNDPEIDFATMMIIHHEGAIGMANLELQSGNNDSLKHIAQKIITEQQSEIEQLKNELIGLTVDNNDPAFSMEQMNNMMKSGKDADIQIITGDIDNDFATLMIVHHQGAIDNASAYLHHGNSPMLKTMATNTVTSQTKEIGELADWLKANKR